MHEYSVVQALLNQCEDIAKKNNATTIHKVTTKIGIMSGIEPHLLQIAFDTFKENTMCHKAKFIINKQNLKLQCKECNHIFEIKEVRYFCIKCESLKVKVLDGEDMYLMSLEMDGT